MLRKLLHLPLIFIGVLTAKELTLQSKYLDMPVMHHMIDLFHTDVLVETGTWGGYTILQGAPLFMELYTVELCPRLFKQGVENLRHIAHAHPYQGESAPFLSKIIPEINGRILFWLDAHWNGEGVRGEFFTAICQEIAAIKDSGLKNGVILIDDMRHFHHDLPKDITPDSEFYQYIDYPSVNGLKELVHQIDPTYQFCVLGDMAIAYPEQSDIIPSALTKAITVSRLYEEGPAYSEVLAAESVISQEANSEEAKAIDRLQEFVYTRHPSSLITYHLVLWEGLLQLGRNQNRQAAASFQQVLDAGYSHWRVYWYLAKAQHSLGNYAQASTSLKKVIKLEPGFQDAHILLNSLPKQYQ